MTAYATTDEVERAIGFPLDSEKVQSVQWFLESFADWADDELDYNGYAKPFSDRVLRALNFDSVNRATEWYYTIGKDKYVTYTTVAKGDSSASESYSKLAAEQDLFRFSSAARRRLGITRKLGVIRTRTVWE